MKTDPKLYKWIAETENKIPKWDSTDEGTKQMIAIFKEAKRRIRQRKIRTVNQLQEFYTTSCEELDQ